MQVTRELMDRQSTVSATVVATTVCCGQVIIVSGETIWVSIRVTPGQGVCCSRSRSLVVGPETVKEDVEIAGPISVVDVTVAVEVSSAALAVMDDCNASQEVSGGTLL